jgi:hypothetical protein
MVSTNNDDRLNIEKVIILLSCVLTLDDREIILFAIEDAIEMLKEINVLLR